MPVKCFKIPAKSVIPYVDSTNKRTYYSIIIIIIPAIVHVCAKTTIK